ncbi:MAG: hypothetical protein QGG96_03230 [Candidatus Poseidoniaceae archaeon]|jgi:hypothetical protein|nr:hypothetical protein [Candidatus Poseidoniaceae archaeon]
MRPGTVIASCVLALAAFLAISPMILFSHSELAEQITSGDLTMSQRASLEIGPFTSQDGEDGIALTGAVFLEDVLFVAGEFSGTYDFGGFHFDSNGSTDLMVARLDSNGSWSWIVVIGGEGLDRSITLELIEDRISVRGLIYGEVAFGSLEIGDDSKNGHQAFVADIAPNNGTWRTAQIDPFGDLSSDPALWCGW